MTLISLPYNPVPGGAEDITEVMADFAAVLAVVNGDLRNDNVAAAAAIAYSKLNLAGSIVNADVSSAAELAVSKLAEGSAGSLLKSTGSAPSWSAVGGSGGLLYGTGSDVAWSGAPATGQELRAVGSVPTWVPPYTYDRNGSQIDISNSSAETSLWSKSIAANDLGTKNALRITVFGVFLNNTGGNRNVTFRIKFGGTTFWADTFTITSAAQEGVFRIEAMLANREATNSQTLSGYVTLTRSVADTGLGGLDGLLTGAGISSRSANEAIDTTSARTFDVTWQFASADASLTASKKFAALELLSGV